MSTVTQSAPAHSRASSGRKNILHVRVRPDLQKMLRVAAAMEEKPVAVIVEEALVKRLGEAA